YSYNYDNSELFVYIYNNDGTYFTDSIEINLTNPEPMDTGYAFQHQLSPALVDLNNDGNLEIVLGLPDGSMGVWDGNGSLIWRYYFVLDPSLNKNVLSPAIGDIDTDGDLEIVVTVGREVYALHHDESLVNGWPQDLGSATKSSPVLFDIEGDDYLEIFVSTYNKIKVYGHYGNEKLQNSLKTQGANIGTVAVGDLDGDEWVDVVVGSMDLNIYAWELGTSSDYGTAGWSELHYDNLNTGCYDCELSFQCSDGIDNDDDGKIDFPEDPSCDSLEDDDETYPEQCQDGIDNDNDGAIDMEDSLCSSPWDNSEGGLQEPVGTGKKGGSAEPALSPEGESFWGRVKRFFGFWRD
ncbi:MAG: VCBS repeat-containing protein, partial [Nanoarchaeota archaeon]